MSSGVHGSGRPEVPGTQYPLQAEEHLAKVLYFWGASTLKPDEALPCVNQFISVA